jgi:hypothetical protein
MYEKCMRDFLGGWRRKEENNFLRFYMVVC